jgi:mRNA-degrading endonuclease RelE of RelBE toxin-antitoxin system
MRYTITVADMVFAFLQVLDPKSRSICKKNLEKLSQPYPGRGSGDKGRIVVAGEEVFRLHIGRTFTAFSIIDERNHQVRVIELLPIAAAHKKYGFR